MPVRTLKYQFVGIAAPACPRYLCSINNRLAIFMRLAARQVKKRVTGMSVRPSAFFIFYSRP